VRRVAASLPLALVLLDVTAVAVLLPDIRLDLGSSSSGAQWVLNAYLLGVAAPLPVLARLRLPPRALVAAGALVLAAGAVVCATADSTAVLVAGRAAQGAGAAALLAHTARGGLTTAALPALALALGPLLGGVFAEENWWRLFFWTGVPLAAVASAAALAAPRPQPVATGPSAARMLAAAGLCALTIALVQTEVWDWGYAALLLTAGAVLVRLGRVDELSRPPAAWAVLSGCVAGLLFVLPEYFQLARDLSGLRSGVLLLAVTFPAVAGWAVSRRLERVPALAPVLAGLACAAIALAVLTSIGAGTAYALLIVLVGLAAAGLGVAGGAAGRVDGPAPRSDPVVAALTGAALGLAAVGVSFQAAEAAERGDGASFDQAVAGGVGGAALMMAFLVAAAGLLLWRPTPASSAARPAAES
jgi:DHA2 family methylenomycin A resistance protein-like MFS transporter